MMIAPLLLHSPLILPFSLPIVTSAAISLFGSCSVLVLATTLPVCLSLLPLAIVILFPVRVFIWTVLAVSSVFSSMLILLLLMLVLVLLIRLIPSLAISLISSFIPSVLVARVMGLPIVRVSRLCGAFGLGSGGLLLLFLISEVIVILVTTAPVSHILASIVPLLGPILRVFPWIRLVLPLWAPGVIPGSLSALLLIFAPGTSTRRS